MHTRIVSALALSLVLTAAAARAQTDYSKIEIKTTKIGGNFYTLAGTGRV